MSNRFYLAIFCLFFISSLFFGNVTNAQTTLAAGDVAIIAFGPSSTDHFAVVLLKDIATGTVINFTDNGLASATTGATGEGYVTYTAPSKQCAGTVLTWTAGMTAPWSSATTGFSLNASGEQLFAFQGNGTNGTTITTNFTTQSGTTSDNEWAAQTGITLLSAIQTKASWITSGNASSSQSYQPSTSILPAIDVIEFTSESDVYITSTSLSGTQSAILTTINTGSSYTTSNSSVTFPSYTSFTVNLIGVTAGTICYSGSAALTASGYSTYTWAPNTNLSASTGTTVTASPTSTTTYTVTGASIVGCTAKTTGVVTFMNNVNVTGASATVDNGQLIISWTNPANCFDEVMVVGKSGSAVTSTPSGDGTAYTSDQFFTGGNSGSNLNTNEYDVYQGTGTSITVFGLTNGTTYDFKIFTKYETNWSTGVTVSGTPNPVTGDFQSRANGNWSSFGTWFRYNGSAWVNATSGQYPQTSSTSVIVGNTVILDGAASPYEIKNLIVQSGGKLYCNTATGTPLYVDIYGNLTCNGTIGNSPSNDDLGIDVDGANCIMDGSGTFACARIRKTNTDNTTTNLTINKSITFLWNTSTQSAFLYNNQGGTNFNVTTASGTTLSCPNSALDVSIDGTNGTSTDERGGTYTINGTLTMAGILHLTTQNTTNACTVVINGTINTATVDASASNKSAAPSVLTINSGGLLNITGTSAITNFSTTDDTYNLNTGSTVQYSAAGAQTIETGMGAYYNLTCSGSGNKTPNNDITINGNLVVNTAALNSPASSTNMTIAGNITMQSSGTMSTNCYNHLKVTTSGNSTQTFDGGTNSIQFYNLTTAKSSGGITLMGGSAETPLNIGNDFSVNYSGSALFTDNGNTIIVGDDAKLGSASANFSLTGTLKFISVGSSNATLSDFTGNLVCPAHLFNLTIDAASSKNILEIIPTPSGGQNLFIDGSVTIANSNSEGTNFNPNGNTINVKGNWTTYGHAGLQASVNGNCTVIFNGTGEAQTISSSDYEVFYNVQENNSSGLTLSSPIHVTNQLTLTSGIIATGSNQLDVTNAATNSVTGYGLSSYIAGALVRNVASTGSYDFPVGTSSNYELATVNINSQTGMSTIEAFFTPGLPATLPNPATCLIGITPIANMLDAGYWTLTPDAFTTVNYDVTLNETGYENFSGIASQIALIKRHDATDSWHGASKTGGGYDGKQGNYVTTGQSISGGTAISKRAGVEGFSDYGIGFGSTVLPITLSSFTAELAENKTTDVQWTTQTEENTDHFEIQRCSDAINFETIGEVNAAGNSEEIINYHWTDEQPLPGVSYYRLKEVDIDATATYSNIQSIENNGTATNDLVIYTVPASDVLGVHFVSTELGVANIQIVNSLGQLIYQGNINLSQNGSNYLININNLPAGNYFLKVVGVNENSVKQFVRE